MEKYEEDGIIYEVYPPDISEELGRMYQERWMADALERYRHIGAIEEAKNNTQYIFLTINPNSHITLLEFVRCIGKMMSKTWMENYLYVFEQRGETLADCGKGFHFHAIIKKPSNKSYQHILRELSSSANKVCDTSNYHFYNLKNISDEEKERKIKYITGRKADVSKHLKQDMDIIFRNNNNLLSQYILGHI